MTLRIQNGRVIDPSRGVDTVADVLVDGPVIAHPKAHISGEEVFDASGLWVVPGLIDVHVHLREPGGEHKENLETGLAAAAAGGFTTVLSMPNTSPPCDAPDLVRALVERAAELRGTRLYPMAVITKGRQGRRVADLEALARAGAVAFTDDGDAVSDPATMRRAFELAGSLGMNLAQHAEDPELSAGGVLHDGEVARKLGVKGWPIEAESSLVARDIALAAETGAYLHVQHVSTEETVELVRKANEEGILVSAEVTPHHLHLTDQAAYDLGTLAKVNPPLRPRRHVEACRRALAEGVIQIIASDHAPHAKEDKSGALPDAAFGMVGLETAVGLMLRLVDEGTLRPLRMIEAMSTAPAFRFNLPGGTLAPGAVADITLINPTLAYEVDPEAFLSKGRNTPYAGWRLPGRAVRTFVNGEVIFNL